MPSPAKTGVTFNCASGLSCYPKGCIPEVAPNGACSSSNACKPPGLCLAGVCTAPPPAGSPCAQDEACGPKHSCDAGVCSVVELPGAGNPCSEDGFCAYGAYCSAGACLKGGLPGDPCTALPPGIYEDTCGFLNAQCVDGVCLPPPEWDMCSGTGGA